MNKEQILQMLVTQGRSIAPEQPIADEQFSQFLSQQAAHPANVPADAQIQDILARFDNHPANVPADDRLEDILSLSSVMQVDQIGARWEQRLSNPRNRDSTIAALENTLKFSADETERRIAQQYLSRLQPDQKPTTPAAPSANVDPAATAPGVSPATSEEVLEGLLYKLSTTRSVDDEAAFLSMLRDLQHGENSTPEQRAAAFQVRLPDVAVSTTPDGRLSFSDRTAPLNVDAETAERLNRIKAQTELLNFSEPVIVGVDDTVRVLGGRATADTNRRMQDTRNALFSASQSPSVQQLQGRLDSISSIVDPAERFEALQTMKPAITGFANERRAEIRAQVYEQYRITELQQQLATEEAKDRADPRYQEFGGVDSEVTANLRQQLRVAQSDAMTMVESQMQSDPILSTLAANYDMVEAIVARRDTDDNRLTLTDMYQMVAPEARSRIDIMGAALLPNWASMSPADRTKALEQNPMIAAAASVTPTQALGFITKPGTEGKQWLEYVRQSEKAGGASEEQLTELMTYYSREATTVRNALNASNPKSVDSSLRGIAEQVATARNTMAATDFARAMELEFIPMAMQARLNAQQYARIAEADQNTKINPGDTTGNVALDEILRRAREADMSLQSLTRGSTLMRLKPADMSLEALAELIPQLAGYVSTRRKENQLSSVLVSPLDTTDELIRSMQGNFIINMLGPSLGAQQDAWRLMRRDQ